MLLGGTAWSLTITEVHYNPPARDGDCEFIELFNESCTVADLSGFRFSRGISYVFPNGTHLDPGRYLVLAADAAAFQARYGFAPDGVYTGRLDSSGETITLENDAWSVDASGGDLHSGCRMINFTYNDRGKWPAACDGTGHSLSLRDPFLDPDDAASWTPSPLLGGTPRADNGLGSGQTATFVAQASTWRYRKGTSAPPSNWNSRTYDDSGWLSGRAGFGYGDNDDNTVLSDMQNGYISVYIRQSFTVADPTGVQTLTLGAWYDDGFVAYLNGTEVARRNVAGNPPVYNVPATASHEAGAWESFDISTSRGLLVQGTNVLAVCGFNRTIDSADFSLDMRLSGTISSIAAGSVVINECLYTGFARHFIEFYNLGDQAVGLDGFHLSDDGNVLDKMRIADGTSVPARGYLVFYEDQLPFPLMVDSVPTGTPNLHIILTAPDLSRVTAAQSFDAEIEEGHSRGRRPDGREGWWECTTPTPGAANQVVVETDLVINEIMYHPAAPHDPYSDGGGDADDLEYLELYNRGGAPISLTGVRFDQGIEFSFQPGAALAAGQYLVLARNPARFREIYGDMPNLYGPYAGRLADGGERVRIVDALGNTVDEVRYHDGGRWPRWADGEGASLELVDARQDNALCTAWEASINPGEWVEVVYTGAHRSVIDSQIGENEFQVCLMTAGEMLLDEIFLGDSLAAANKIANGSFDASTTGWVIQGTHRDSVRTTGDAAAGGGALKVISTGRGDNRCNRLEYNTLALTPGGTHYVRYHAKWLRGSNMLMTRTHRHGVVRTTPIPMAARIGTPGAPNSVARSTQGPVYDDLVQSPGMPASSTQVVITVRAHDADGIRSLNIRHRADGTSTFASAPMYDDGAHGDGQAGDGIYGGTVPAYAANTVVQFYVEGTDDSAARNQTTFPIEGAAAPWVWIVKDSVYTGSRHYYHLAMSAADYAMLSGNASRGEAMSNYLWPASLVANAARIHHGIGIRYRGSPWIRPSNPEAGYRFRFNRDDLLYGIHYEINLDRNDNDGTRQKDRTASYMMRKLGAPNPYVKLPYNRGEYIALRFNNSDKGGYEQIQKIDGDYLEYWWRGNDKGNYYKVDDWFESFNDANPVKILTANLTYRGENKETYRWFFSLRSNELLDDYYPLIELCRNLQQYTLADLDTAAAALMDVPEWAGILAVRFFIGDWDTLGFDRGKNAYLYFAPGEGAKLVPWDSDLTFQSGYVGAKLYPEAGGGDAYFPNMAKVFQRPWARRLMNQSYAYLIGAEGPANRANLDWILDATAAQAGLGSPIEIKNFVASRATVVRGYLSTAAFQITEPNGGADFTSTTAPVVVRGKASSEVDRIIVNARDETPYLRWPALDTWELTLPLVNGSVRYTFTAYNRAGRQIGSDSIVITFSGPVGPRILGFQPARGLTSGGYEIAISAMDFFEPVQVSIGGKACTSCRAEGGLVKAVVPPGAGFAAVTLTSGNELSDTAAARFWYVAPPPPLGISFMPTHGPAAGGTEVAILGSNFGQGARVYFGDRESPSVLFVSAQEIRAVTPSPAPGIMRVRVKIVSAEGLASIISSPYFEYDPGPAPIITGVSPAEGSTGGGTEVAITGGNFSADPAAIAVRFDTVLAHVLDASETQLRVLTPPHAAGTVAVVVVNPDGASGQAAGAFTYISVPVRIDAFTPECGPFEGGNEVHIIGDGFVASSVVVLFGVSVADIVSSTAREIVALAPAGTGSVAISVYNPDSQSATAPLQYTYTTDCRPAIDSIEPAFGPEEGGTTVTIRGRNLSPLPDITQVMFGTGSAVIIPGGTSREVAVVTPPGTGT
ncbi:MAG TPA: hypothetical protein DCM87_20685, partial [Planctomycetes bacterium]|nr:hypothetical protein [Planctomycetota bacterium]